VPDNERPEDYRWLHDREYQPEPKPDDTTAMPAVAEEAVKRHGVRRGLIATSVAIVLVAGVVGADMFVNHTSDSDVAAHHNKPQSSQSIQSGETLTPKPPTEAECIAKLPLSLKLAQKIMISADASNTAYVGGVMARNDVGGVIFMGPVPSAGQAGALTSRQRIAPLKASDQEGDPVQRYTSGGTLPSPAKVPALWTPAQAEAHVRQSDLYIKSQGVNMNLAPLADVSPVGGSSVLGPRIFSSSPSVVATYDKAYVQAGLDTGVLPTLKHFPGLGGATGNTDYGPASSPAELYPYKALAGTKTAVMVGNQTVPGYSTVPASLSRNVITNLLRVMMCYTYNVFFTESLSA
jgi:beta-N-acetylhexosaminidase